MKGFVKWFSNKKGYGFITPDNGDQDIFVHHTGISGESYKSLEEGEGVVFDVVQSPKGDRAVNLTKIEKVTLQQPEERAA